MANLKRNMIELVLEVKEGEIVTKKYVTPVFIPLSVVYEAIDLMAELNSRKSGQAEKDMIDKVLKFVAEKVYNNQFTRDDLFNYLHGPGAINELFMQVLFVARGEQTEEAKKYLESL